MDVAFAASAPLGIPPRPRSPRSRRRPRPRTPQAFNDLGSDESRPERARVPSPWVQAALLTLFEPAPERTPPPPPSSRIPKWLAVWQSLTALYALRFRLGPPAATTTVREREREDDDVVLVETPGFHQATGFDPARGLARVVVCISDLMADAVVLEMVSRVDRPLDVALIAAGVVTAYASADLVSALYNWLRLNFSPNASLFGERDGAGVGAGATRSFSKLVAPHCAAVMPFFALMLASPPGELAGDAFVCYFLTFFSLLPAFGEWSAAERTPLVITLLQRAGVIVRRSTEDAYHRLEYGVVCGIWDSFLKRMEVFAALERWIYVHSGGRIRPKVWDVAPHTVPEDLRDFVPGFSVEEPGASS